MAQVPCRSDEPGREETVVFPDWVMLDRIGRTNCHDNHAAASEAVSKDKTAVAFDTTSGYSCHFSFTLAAPPSVSYLNLHWSNRPAKSVFPNMPACSYVLAADKNLILLHIDIPSHPHWDQVPSDLFVYKVGPSPSLLRLPVCDDCPVGWTSLCNFSLGVLQLSGYRDRYIVSDLIISRGTGDSGNSPIFAKVCFYSSKRESWRIITKSSPQLHGQNKGQFPILWSSDDVLPFDGRFLCWIDYFSGVLLADFSKIKSSALHFLPFPGKQYTDEVWVSRLCPGRCRNVSISKGAVRFIQIDNDWHENLHIDYDWDYNDSLGRSQPQPSGSKITIWTLNVVDSGDFKLEWVVHRVINLHCLWAQCSYQAEHIPERLPEFPVMAVDDPDVLCCLVREEEYFGKAWMIMIDLKYAYLRSCFPYINEQPCYAEGMGVETCRSMFADVPLLTTVFSRGHKVPAGIPCDDKDKLATRPSKKGKLLM